MPTCDHCESHVSADWQRVYSIDGEIPVCPHCPDRQPDPKAAGGFSEYRNDRTGLAADGGNS